MITDIRNDSPQLISITNMSLAGITKKKTLETMNIKNKEGTKMKTQKLIVMAAIFCLLVGASGAAMAVEDCAGGLLTGIIDEDIVIDGGDCLIRDASVNGDIEVSNAEDITVLSTQASGVIRIQNSGVASVIASSARNIRVRRNNIALVVGSAAQRNLVVNANLFAGVKQNGAIISIICRRNQELDARFNNTEGVEECNSTD